MVRAQRRVHPSARWYAARAGSMITKVSEHDSARPALRHGSRELHHTPLPLMRDMNTQTERSPTFSTSINRANAVQGLVALYRLADALRAVGDSDLAAGWEATLCEMERCMSRGWKNRNGRAITQFNVTVDLEPGLSRCWPRPCPTRVGRPRHLLPAQVGLGNGQHIPQRATQSDQRRRTLLARRTPRRSRPSPAAGPPRRSLMVQARAGRSRRDACEHDGGERLGRVFEWHHAISDSGNVSVGQRS